jgi:membrane associated rhomboid family serine protease
VIILFPLGVEDAEVNRLPWVSIGIAGLCALTFLLTWVVPENPHGPDESALIEVVQYWRQHPYLNLSGDFQGRFIRKDILQRLKPDGDHPAPEPELAEKEQATLDEMAARAVASSERSTLRRFSLIPARGMAQIGWLTHMFLHFGWLHLLGNLFFFYLVGPLLEDIWGRPLFAGFYVVGGLAAASAHVLLDRSSAAMMGGASGAIAACMGAFAMRYATRRIRLAYFVFLAFRIWRGTTLWPAWFCGLLWFLNEGWSFWRTGGNSGVAVMAHLGGFAFGAAVAFGLRASGIESKYVAPKVEATFTWQQHPAIQKAAEALERKELSAAQAGYREALAADPNNLEAQFGLAKVALFERGPSEAARQLDPLLTRLIAHSETDQAVPWIEDILPQLDPKQLRPAFAYKVGQIIDAAPEGLRPLGERFYARAGEAGAVLGAKAYIRAAAIALAASNGAEAALRHLAAAEAIPEIPASCKAQVAELRANAKKKLPIAIATADRTSPDAAVIPLITTANAAASLAFEPGGQPKPVILPCRLNRISEAGLDVDVQSRKAIVAWNRIEAIGVGIIPALLVMDLVVSAKAPGGQQTVLRIPGGALGLNTLFPGIRPQEAFHQLISELLHRSGARPLASIDGMQSGNYPRFADISELESTFYGVAA